MKHINKIALITGGSRGLGRNAAIKLARDGADVILTYSERSDEGKAVLAQIEKLGRKAEMLQLDVANTAGFDAFVQTVTETLQTRWQRKDFDFLINNAGVGADSLFGQTTEEAFDRLFNVHLRGVYFLTQKLLPLIAGGGRIICTSTGLTRFAIPGYAAYASMKGAIEVLVRYLAKELGPRSITANALAPGAIETDFTSAHLERPGMKDILASNTALGRVGVPDDIGGVVSFLCSEEGRWVTAQRLEASGGMFL